MKTAEEPSDRIRLSVEKTVHDTVWLKGDGITVDMPIDWFQGDRTYNVRESTEIWWTPSPRAIAARTATKAFYAEISESGEATDHWIFHIKQARPDELVNRLLDNQGVNWDRHGIGSVPAQIDIDYFGFTTQMTAGEFQRLVPPGVSNPGTKDLLRPKAEAGEAIAPPFLVVNWDEENKMWDVIDHEGRSRSRLVSSGDTIPVDILPRGMRARDVTPEMKKAGFIPQRRR